MFRVLRIAWVLCAATLACPAQAPAPDARMAVLTRLVGDESPKVRLEALRALARIPTAESAALALSVLEKPMDPALDYALWLTINDLAEPWIAALQSGAWKPEGREPQLAFALKALESRQVARILGSVLADRPLPRDGSGPWIEALGAAGAPEHLGRLLRQIAEGGFDPAASARALKALADAARLRQVQPVGDLTVLKPFLRSSDATVRAETIRLVGWWKAAAYVEPLAALLDGAAPVPSGDPVSPLVFESLRQIGGEPAQRALRALATRAGADPRLRRGAAVSLAALDAGDGFPVVVQSAATLSDEPSALEFWRSVLGIKGAGPRLVTALGGARLPEAAARAGMRVAREGGRADLELVAALAQAGGLAADAGEATAAAIRDLAARALAEGDPRLGERVYRRTDLACVTCHAIGGVGGKVGPDLTSIGASAPADYLVEALLLPNAKIKEGYHSVILETRDGEEISGTLARETPDEVFLRNAAGQEVAVAKSTVARRETGKLSLMPSGLLDPLPARDRADLVAFLSRLGKPGEFDASRGGIARVWRLAHVVHTDVQNSDAEWFWKRPLDDRRFAVVTSLASGSLPRPLLEDSLQAQAWTAKVAVVAVTELEQAAEGRLRFRLGAAGSELWIDGRRAGAGPDVEAVVPAGRPRVVVRMDPRSLPEFLRLEADGAVFLRQ